MFHFVDVLAKTWNVPVRREIYCSPVVALWVCSASSDDNFDYCCGTSWIQMISRLIWAAYPTNVYCFFVMFMTSAGPSVLFSPIRSDLHSSSLSHKNALRAEPIRLGGDTDYSVASFTTVPRIGSFIYLSTFFVTRSAATSSWVLHCMNASFGATKKLAERTFTPGLSTASPEMEGI